MDGSVALVKDEDIQRGQGTKTGASNYCSSENQFNLGAVVMPDVQKSGTIDSKEQRRSVLKK